MRFICISIIIIFHYFISFSQKDVISVKDYYIYKNEIGINVTNVLGNVLSLNPDNTNSPYGITYRRHYDNWSFRSAMNINFDNIEEDDFDNGAFFTRKLNSLGLQTRFGMEKHMVLSKRVMFSYGIDALLGLDREHSEINNFNLGNTTFINKDMTYAIGLGPMLRLEYKISDRLFFSTESSLYGNYSVSTSKLTINGNTEEEPKKTNSQLKLVIPQSLFFNISF